MLPLSSITTFIFDIDGVLTDGSILLLENGLQARKMNVKDGYALQLAVKKGYRILVVSGGPVTPAVDRLLKLGINDVHMAVTNKRQLVSNYIDENKLVKGEICFMGDDIPDLSAMQLTGLPACPADAVAEIKEIAAYISPYKGGEGCVRDIVEQVMRARNHWTHEEHVPSK